MTTDRPDVFIGTTKVGGAIKYALYVRGEKVIDMTAADVHNLAEKAVGCLRWSLTH